MALSFACYPSLAIFSLLLASSLAANPEPIALQWSNKTYGPDGPWHALHVGIGTPVQHVDLFPNYWVTSWPLLPEACEDATQENACAGGTYDPRKSTSARWQPDVVSEEQVPFIFNTDEGPAQYAFLNGTNVTTLGDDATLYLANSKTIKVPKTGFDSLGNQTHSYVSYIGSKFPTYPLTAGYFTMGYPLTSVIYSTSATQTYNILLSWLAKEKIIPSASIGMTYGSTALNIPPSYYMGGYDRNRVVGPVLTQKIKGGAVPEVTLGRIYLGNELGPTVFPNASSSVLTQEGLSGSTVLADVDPGASTLGLPTKTCRNLEKELPIKFDESIGFYLWNTNDPAYDKIMKSSSYLAFDLQPAKGSKTDFITIKIPMQLLNLTLESPITPNPVPYFPCMDVKFKASSNVLGRPFLQAAFLHIEWSLLGTASYWALAQAPGPNMPENPDVADISGSVGNIKSADFKWAETWAGFWKDGSTSRGLVSTPSKDSSGQSQGQSGPSSGPSSDGGLSTGAKAGIGVGVALGVIILAVAAFFILRRTRKKQEPAAPILEKAELPEDEAERAYSPDKKVVEELDGNVTRPELPQTNSQVYVEMPGSQPQPSELDDTQTKLPATENST